ncbi:hypothetical protein JTE90_000510 [Oedothorax gibbosus]|uniref:Ribonuclease H n=1 Tax=Oedothorax gibbosus TaxID=931172 RepID=A0AAV6VU04_9ARAC|nr:hypothetical protein JTE90_000510 [Oedothorax gibbosus]
MGKTGFYAVKCGRVPGVYKTWPECEAQVKGFPKAKYKKFPDKASAREFVGFNSSEQGLSINQTSSSNISSIPSTSKFNFSAQQSNFREQPSTSFQTHSQTEALISNKLETQASMSDEPDGSTSFEEHLMDEFFKNFVNESSKKREVYYAVHRGTTPGIYRTWTECEAQIKNTKNASYRKFDNEKAALEYVQTGGIVKATKREIQEIKYNNRVVKKQKTSHNDKPQYVLQNGNEPVVVFTDGASAQNGRKNAQAGIGVYWGPSHPLNASKRLTGRQTNNRAEIQAAVYALNQARQIGARKVKLYTDSQFLIHGITDWIHKWKKNGWKLVTGEPVVNKEDFLELEAVSQGIEVDWTYVKAHAKNRGNDEADRLAVDGSRLVLEPANCSEFPNPLLNAKIEPFILTSASSSAEEIRPLIIPEESVERKVFYAVCRGNKPGVYKTWTECEKQIKGFVKPWFKKFSVEDDAIQFVETGKVVKKVNVPDHGPDEFVTVFTDGASSCNGTEDAKAGIGVYWGPGNELNTSARLPGRQTNNRAEIHAAVHALQQARQLGIKNVRLYTDSQFVIKGITEWIDKWKQKNWMSSNGKPVINKEDFMVLDRARQGLNVDWCYVKGHDNNPGNVEADKLAIKALVRACIPRKNPKEWVKGKCEDNTEKQGDIETCYQCVDDFVLPQNATRDDVQAMRKACLPQPSMKFRAKRKCVKRLRNKHEIEACNACIQSYKLSDKPSCEEVSEMKRQCITGRTGRDLWTDPILQDDDEDESS